MAVAGAGMPRANRESPLFAAPEVVHRTLADGSLVIGSARRLGPIPRAVGVWLERWGQQAPHPTVFAQRAHRGGRRPLTVGGGPRATPALRPGPIEPRPLWGPPRPRPV